MITGNELRLKFTEEDKEILLGRIISEIFISLICAFILSSCSRFNGQVAIPLHKVLEKYLVSSMQITGQWNNFLH